MHIKVQGIERELWKLASMKDTRCLFLISISSRSKTTGNFTKSVCKSYMTLTEWLSEGYRADCL